MKITNIGRLILTQANARPTIVRCVGEMTKYLL